MLRIFVEEAAALASLALFVGMIAVWAQVFSSFEGQAVGSRRRLGNGPLGKSRMTGFNRS